jgi:hypothetical protein
MNVVILLVAVVVVVVVVVAAATVITQPWVKKTHCSLQSFVTSCKMYEFLHHRIEF